MRVAILALLAALALPAASADASAADKVTKEALSSGGRARAYYLYVPGTVGTEAPAPLIVCLHGSGRNGSSLVDKWKDLAKKEGIILAGPDSIDSQEWNLEADGPDFIRDVVAAVSAKHPVDPKRVYVFGHSAGAVYGLVLALIESETYAAVAVHAGALPADFQALADRATRKTPVAIWVGTNDPFFPVAAVRATRGALAQHGITVQVTEIAWHTHDYYGRSSEINKAAWAFLKQHALTPTPPF
jgi:poly(3-hydroxybutyrate) depolymerase